VPADLKWTKENVKEVIKIIKTHTTLQEAYEEARKALGWKFGLSQVRFQIKAVTGKSPQDFLKNKGENGKDLPPPPPKPYNPLEAAHNLSLEEKLGVEKKKRQMAEKQLMELQKTTSILQEAERRRKASPVTSQITPVKGKRVAVPVIMCSDWHIGEVVRPEVVSGLNEFNIDVATRRIEKLWQGALWQVDHQSSGYEFDRVVLWLGGDLIHNWIHEEFLNNTDLTPIEQVVVCSNEIERGLTLLLKELPKKVRFTVLCSVGNHGRTTRRKHTSRPAKTNLEYGMYASVAKLMNKHTTRLDWEICEGSVGYYPIWDWTLRYTHGDDINYQGGVQGLKVPFSKAIHAWDTGRRADITIAGHWHSMSTNRSPDFLINDALVGYSGYAVHKKIMYGKPAQAFFMLDRKWGRRETTAIHV
jgi:hypothetical protein